MSWSSAKFWTLGIAIVASLPVAAESISLESFTPVYAHGEYRPAYQIESDGEYDLQVGAVQEDAILLLSVYAESGITIDVTANQESIATRRSFGDEAWIDFRIEIPERTHNGETLRIKYDCAAGTIIARPTYVPRDTEFTPVLIYLVDTLRNDRIGCYGGTRGLTPNIDAFAKDAIRATRMVPASSWTRPSVASMLTGMHPPAHGAEDATDYLRQDIPSLAGELGKAGYRGVGFMSNPNCLPEWGFGVGFDVYKNAYAHEWEVPTDKKVVDLAIQSVRHMADVPWFVYAHVMGPHNPYSPEKWFSLKYRQLWYSGTPQEKRIAREIDAYDAEVNYADYHFGRLINELKRQGLYDRALIVFTSDHGEELWEHGINGHGESVRETLLRIPLIIKLPNNEGGGRVVDDSITHADIYPTILEALRFGEDDRVQGKSRLNSLLDEETIHEEEVTLLTRTDYAFITSQHDGQKVVRNLNSGESLWFDLENDPEERQPLAAPPENATRLERIAECRFFEGRAGMFVSLPSAASDVSITFPDAYEHSLIGLHADEVSWSGTTLRIVCDAGEGLARGVHIDAPPDAEISFADDTSVFFLGSEPADGSVKPLFVRDIASAPGAVPWKIEAPSITTVWAVEPPPNSETQGEMTDEMRESLEGLGYL